jgi:replicative DNA helicase
MKANDLPNANDAVYAEQSLLGALMLDNEALYRVPDVKAEHFYRADHRAIFEEICKQIGAGKTADPITLFASLQTKVDDCLHYLTQIATNTTSAASANRYADIVMDRALKRSVAALGGEMMELRTSLEPADTIIDRLAAKVEALAQKQTRQEPQRLNDMLGSYVDVIQARMDGKIKPISTGFADLDRRLDGGLERGTLTVVAGRPAMGKTAFGLGIARNVAEWGSSLFLSMEMSRDQVNDRLIAALGKLPIAWLRRPDDRSDEGKQNFNRMTHAFQRAQELNLYIDDQTALNMLDIRAKSRSVKRKQGLDVLVIDQLSFIAGGASDKSWEVVGEHTRGLLQLAKELNIAIVLLCQLNRKCEERNNKRPMLSDLAVSGSIEQDAANVIFLYRDEVYNSETMDKGVCEVITAKQRQGEPGTVGLAYIGNQTRFEDLATPWQPSEQREKPRSRGFD